MNWFSSVLERDNKTMTVAVILLTIACHFSLFGASLGVVLLYVGVLIAWFKAKKISIPDVPVKWGFAAFFVSLLISGFFSTDSGDVLRLFFQKRLPLWSISIFIPFVFDTKEDAKELLKYFLIFGVITSAASITQYIVSNGEIERLTMFTHYMTAGGMLMTLSLLMIPVVITKGSPKSWKIFSGVGLLITLPALILTSTRSSWLGFILGVIIIGIMMRKEIIYLLLVGIVVFFFFAPQNMKERVESIWNLNHPNNIGRLHMWEGGIEIWKNNPILGVGDHDLKTEYAKYRKPAENEDGGHLHNIVIMWLATGGLLGLSAMLFLLYQIGYGLLKTYHSGNDWITSSISMGGFACFFGYLLNGMFEWNFGDTEIVTYMGLIYGYSWIVLKDNTKNEKR